MEQFNVPFYGEEKWCFLIIFCAMIFNVEQLESEELFSSYKCEA